MKLLTTPFDALVSFHYFNGKNNEQMVTDMARAGMRVIGDSGAFSAMTSGKPINIDEFAAWAERHRDHLAWTASLDAIGDPSTSWKNWRYLSTNGLETVPTIHYGTEPEAMDRYAERGVDFMGLGGVAARKDRKNVLRWLVAMFRHARDHHPAMRFHGWGLTSRQYMAHLPFYSVDSSGFGAGYRYGTVSVWHPELAKNVSFRANGKESAQHAATLRRYYGASPRELATSHSDNRAQHVHLTALSAQYMTEHYTRRHRVSPPASQGPVGTRVHWVDSSKGNIQYAVNAILNDQLTTTP